MPPFPPFLDYWDLIKLAAYFQPGGGITPYLTRKGLDALGELTKRLGPVPMGLVQEGKEAINRIGTAMYSAEAPLNPMFEDVPPRGVLSVPTRDIAGIFSRLTSRLNTGLPYVDLLREVGGLPESYQTPLEAALGAIAGKIAEAR